MTDLNPAEIEPLDLASIEARDAAAIARMRPRGPSNTEWNAEPGTYEAYRERSWFDAEHDRRTLLTEVNRLRAALAAATEREQALKAIAQDERNAKKTAAECADRFRDVASEVLSLPENPGDDELVRLLRAAHGKTGPEPTRWRDFLTGAVAHLEANGLTIGAPLDGEDVNQ